VLGAIAVLWTVWHRQAPIAVGAQPSATAVASSEPSASVTVVATASADLETRAQPPPTATTEKSASAVNRSTSTTSVHHGAIKPAATSGATSVPTAPDHI
ncbi:MAG: hypothetical protein ACRELY_28735, partial [Polyangiaceae bacterium]